MVNIKNNMFAPPVSESSSEGDDRDETTDDEVEDEEKDNNENGLTVTKVFKTKKTKGNSSGKKRKNKKAHLRRNIRNVFDDTKLAERTQKLRDEENERRRRLGVDVITKGVPVIKSGQVLNDSTSLKRKPPDVICLDSDSDDGSKPFPPLKKSVSTKEVVVLSSDSDEEDLDNFRGEKKTQSDDYYSELGLHTNDLLNIRDTEGRVLINVNHTDKDKDIFVHAAIANALKPHQIGGVRFLYDNLIESISGFQAVDGNGCILAHAMGLGKTIQTITFIDIFLRYTSSKKVLCVVPVNTIQNWLNEFNRWLPPGPSKQVEVKKQAKPEDGDKLVVKALLDEVVDFIEYRIGKMAEKENKDQSLTREEDKTEETKEACEMSYETVKDNTDVAAAEDGKNYRRFNVYLCDAQKSPMGRAKVIEEWDQVGGVLLMGYEMYRSIALYSRNKKNKGKGKRGNRYFDEDGEVFPRLKKAICRPGPDLVVCDEGHRIRNYQSGISQALKSIRTRKRLVLTGYPLQNNLIEYWCMVDFVRPNYLGSRQEFANMFERPIMNGQCVDSTDKDKMLMRQRAHVLYSLLEGFVQRRGHNVFQNILPPKEEHVLMVRLSPIQIALYRRLCELTKEAYNDSLNPIKTFCLCCKIWNHPAILYNAVRASLEGKQMDIISDEDDITLDESTNKVKRKKKPSSTRSSPQMMTHSHSISQLVRSSSVMENSYTSQIGLDPFNNDAREILTDIPQWAGPIFQEHPFNPSDIENSGKFFVLKELIYQSISCGDKMLIFSQSLLTLNTIEEMLQDMPVTADRCWKKGRDYVRLDGSTGSLEREKLINLFNDKRNVEVKLFLLSTRAGCLGINLVSANRVVVFDVSWNPCHDAQAVCRIYRYGQTKRCYIYRLVSSNTMEKKIYYRQISKQGISDRVVDELSLTENFCKSDIQSLIVEDWVDEPVVDFSNIYAQFQDSVLSNVMRNCGGWITKTPFKHESLLIEEQSRKLNGVEKRAAKRAYEQERMMAQGSHVPYRSYPLQQNFPRNTPVVPVRPFLWHPPTQSTSWPNLQSNLLPVANNITVPYSAATARAPSSEEILRLLQRPGYPASSAYLDNMDTNSQPMTRITTPESSVLTSLLTSARNALSGPRINTPNISTVRFDRNPLLNINQSNSVVSDRASILNNVISDAMTTRVDENAVTNTSNSRATSGTTAPVGVNNISSNQNVKTPTTSEHSYYGQLDPSTYFNDLLLDQDASAQSFQQLIDSINTHQEGSSSILVLDDED